MNKKLFDLNIGEVLDAWGIEHALREIIANALDEQILTKSDEIKIWEDEKGIWHIRDYGRGLQEIHLKQDENPEKMSASNLIGKFGVGLKDALAVFYRKNISVEILSKHLNATLAMSNKSGFDTIQTLHAVIVDTQDNNFIGTEFILTGITLEYMKKAKAMFLKFSDSELIEKTSYGEVYTATGIPCIYINGVRVAQESNFMFSYNITNISAAIKKALNRERSNVGRTAYTDSVKKILTSCKSEIVLEKLVSDLDNIMRQNNKDESAWIEISSYAVKTLNKSGNVVFMTPSERAALTNAQVEILNESGKKLILIPDKTFEKLQNSIFTFSDAQQADIDNYKFDFVSEAELTSTEREIFKQQSVVLQFLKKYGYKNDKPIKISNTMRIDPLIGVQPAGLWDPVEQCVIIKRSVLKDGIARLFGVLIHEFAHYNSGASDNTREFENILTDMLGYTMTDILSTQGNHN